MKKKQFGFNKVKSMYDRIFLISLYSLSLVVMASGNTIHAASAVVVNALEVIQASTGKGTVGGQQASSMSLATIGALTYSALKSSLSTASITLSEVTGQGTLTTSDTFSFSFGNAVDFAMPTTTWAKTAVPDLYTQLDAVSGFNLSTGVTYVMLAFDANNNFISDLTTYKNVSGTNFYLFAYDAQGVSLFPAGIAVPVATMGNVTNSSMTTNTVNIILNTSSTSYVVNKTVNYPASLIVTSSAVPASAPANSSTESTVIAALEVISSIAGTNSSAAVPASTVSPAQTTAPASAINSADVVSALELIASVAGQPSAGQLTAATGKSTLTKPIPASQTISLQPTTDPKALPATTELLVIPSAISRFTVFPSTNVGDLYTSFSFSAANLALINAAIAKGTSLQFALNVQQNNANYNVTGTVYDLSGNVIATEVRNNVVNRAGAGVTNTANIAVGSPITVPAVFTYYDIQVTLAGQTTPSYMKNGMSLASTAILAAPAQSIAITSPVQNVDIVCNGATSGFAVDVALSIQNLMDINKALAAGTTLTMSVSMVPNAQNNYDFVFVVYNPQGDIVAQEVRSSVVNSSSVTNSANIGLNQVIPVTATTFAGANITCTLLNTNEDLIIENLPFTSSVALAPNIPSSSVVPLKNGISSLTSILIIGQFGQAVIPSVTFNATDFADINKAIAAGDSVSIQCRIEEGQMLIGAYEFTKQELIAVENFGLPSGVTAADFSGYQLQYLVQGQTAGQTAVPANQKLQCAFNQTVTFMPAVTSVSVTPSILPGKNGATTFVANTASLQPLLAQTELPYNQTPVSIAGGLTALQMISVQLTDANTTAYLQFNFTPTAGLQNITQEILNNGLYVCMDIAENIPAQGQFSAVVSLLDAQSNVYASGSAPITTQMVYGWVGFNTSSPTAAQTATTTSVSSIPLAQEQAVVYRQQTVTTPGQ